MATPARLVGIGVFVLGGLLLFTVGLFMIGDRQMAFARKVTIYTEFKKITGLQPGGIVRVSGAKAGAIQKIIPPHTPGGKFRVQFDITEELHPLVRLDSIASIETEGLVGGNYLGVGSGTDASAAAAAGATIGSKEPFEIAELMQQMSDTIVKVNVTIQTVNDSIDEMKADVQRAVVSGADTIDVAHKLLLDVSGDVKAMAANGARLSADAAQIAETIRKGEGSLGKLVNDDELYVRTTSVAKQAEEIAAGARQVVEQARTTLAGFQSKDGPVEGMAAGLKQTMDDARKAMSAFAENMEALKHNFLVRGFFKDRGFFNLADMSPAAYRQGALTKGGLTRSSDIWLKAITVFEPAPDDPATERLTREGRSQLDAAIGPFLDRASSAVLVIEGYAQSGNQGELYLRSRVRASLVRDYFLGKFGLTPQSVGVMALGNESAGSPDGEPWDGVALAMFDDKKAAGAKGR
jgi:phospholipid/cholesterol/gamma-HCH transport system substrate-binding protein